MADFLAMADEIGSVYLSLPQNRGRLKMSKPIPPQLATKEMLEEMIAEVYTTHEVMMDDIYRRLNEIYYPIDRRIGWIHKFVENIKERLTKQPKEHEFCNKHRPTPFQVSVDTTPTIESLDTLLSLIDTNHSEQSVVDGNTAVDHLPITSTPAENVWRNQRLLSTLINYISLFGSWNALDRIPSSSLEGKILYILVHQSLSSASR
ncbi:hypothetical protein YC2023_011037 [Brassica napus]